MSYCSPEQVLDWCNKQIQKRKGNWNPRTFSSPQRDNYEDPFEPPAASDNDNNEDDASEDDASEDSEEQDDFASIQTTTPPATMPTTTPNKTTPSRSVGSARKRRTTEGRTTTEDLDSLSWGFGAVNLHGPKEHQPRCIALPDNETMIVLGLPFIAGMEDENSAFHKYNFNEEGSQLEFYLKVSKEQRTPDGVCSGWDHCHPGSKWYSLVELALKAEYGGIIPGTPKGDDEWQLVSVVKLPHCCDKKFYIPNATSLEEVADLSIAESEEGGIMSCKCFLKRVFVQTSEVSAKSIGGKGNAMSRLESMRKARQSMACKYAIATIQQMPLST